MSILSSQLRGWADRLRWAPLHPQWLLGTRDKMAGWIKEKCKGLVLDIGAADRWIDHHLEPKVKYISLDYPATGQNLYNAKPDIFGNAAQLPIRTESIDTVVLFEVMEHLEDPRSALEEIHRVLKPGGTLLLTMPFLYPLHDEPFDYQRYTEFGLRRELNATGFKINAFSPTLGSAETIGLLSCITLGGIIEKGLKEFHPTLLLAPFLMILIALINLSTWAYGKIAPSWPNVTTGFKAEATKPK